MISRMGTSFIAMTIRFVLVLTSVVIPNLASSELNPLFLDIPPLNVNHFCNELAGEQKPDNEQKIYRASATKWKKYSTAFAAVVTHSLLITTDESDMRERDSNKCRIEVKFSRLLLNVPVVFRTCAARSWSECYMYGVGMPSVSSCDHLTPKSFAMSLGTSILSETNNSSPQLGITFVYDGHTVIQGLIEFVYRLRCSNDAPSEGLELAGPDGIVVYRIEKSVPDVYRGLTNFNRTWSVIPSPECFPSVHILNMTSNENWTLNVRTKDENHSASVGRQYVGPKGRELTVVLEGEGKGTGKEQLTFSYECLLDNDRFHGITQVQQLQDHGGSAGTKTAALLVIILLLAFYHYHKHRKTAGYAIDLPGDRDNSESVTLGND